MDTRDRLDEILDYTLRRLGAEPAKRYIAQLADRLTALAAGGRSSARFCALPMRTARDMPGLRIRPAVAGHSNG